MCRIAAYLGAPVPLSALTHEPPHSLLVQSYRPRQMQEALLNADGAGVAWFVDDGNPSPCRYRTAMPLWSDENLASMAPRIRSQAIVASVRSATPGLPVGAASTAPFLHGRLAFAHNGYLEDFCRTFLRPMRDRLSDEAHARLGGGTDSEHLFALMTDGLGESFRLDELVLAVREAIRTCAAIASERGRRAVINSVLSDGRVVVASRFASSGTAPSLYVATGSGALAEGTVVSSEPFDPDPLWTEVPEDSLVVVTRGAVERIGIQ